MTWRAFSKRRKDCCLPDVSQTTSSSVALFNTENIAYIDESPLASQELKKKNNWNQIETRDAVSEDSAPNQLSMTEKMDGYSGPSVLHSNPANKNNNNCTALKYGIDVHEVIETISAGEIVKDDDNRVTKKKNVLCNDFEKGDSKAWKPFFISNANRPLNSFLSLLQNAKSLELKENRQSIIYPSTSNNFASENSQHSTETESFGETPSDSNFKFSVVSLLVSRLFKKQKIDALSKAKKQRVGFPKRSEEDSMFAKVPRRKIGEV